MVLRQELLFTLDMSQRTAINIDSEFREKRIYQIIKIGMYFYK